MSKTKTHDEFIREMSIKNPSVEIIGNYINNSTKIETRCKIDGHIWYPRPNFLLTGGGCPVCNKVNDALSKKKSNEDYDKELYLKFSGKFSIADNYVNNITKVKIRCNVCSNIFNAYPSTFLTSKGICPYCSGAKVIKGLNDLWTTHPDLAKLLANPEDGYTCSFKTSTVRLKWKCPDCGYIKDAKLSNVKTYGLYCENCDDNISYGEKFVSNFLMQLNAKFKKEKVFSWSDNKFYDFYIGTKSCIIETHGQQHYKFTGLFKRSLEDEQENDKHKFEMAINNNIKNYIILDCRKSNASWVKNSILNSNLPIILNFKEEDINWNECNKFATTSLIKSVYLYYLTHNVNQKALSNKFNLCTDTIRKYIKQGSEIGFSV